MSTLFHPRISVERVEEGCELAPKFDASGVIHGATTDFARDDVLMHADRNQEALRLTMQTGEAHYSILSSGAIYHVVSQSCLYRPVLFLGATTGQPLEFRELKKLSTHRRSQESP
jgi:phosphoribosyl-AMP cyclohydrolase